MNTVSTDSSTRNHVLKDRTSLTVAFCGGGSGGHLTPAITLAQTWVHENPNIRFRFLFLCSGRTIDQTILSNTELLNCDVQVAAQTVTTSAHKFKLLNGLRKDFMTCLKTLKQERPHVVLGMGGFASVAPVLAAKRLNQSPVLLEWNAIPGKANRWLSRLSTAVWTGWPLHQRSASSLKATSFPFGIPVHQTTAQPTQANASGNHASRTLIIAGGSLGANRLNNLACDALAQNRHLLQDWNIKHQTGSNWQPSAVQQKDCAGLNWNRRPFIPHLAKQFSTADVIISRAGAVTLAEIAHAQVASILIPLSTAADQHQAANAKLFDETQAAFVVDEVHSSAPVSLAECLKQLICDQSTRQQMQQHCTKLHDHLILQNASEILANLLIHTAPESHR